MDKFAACTYFSARHFGTMCAYASGLMMVCKVRVESLWVLSGVINEQVKMHNIWIKRCTVNRNDEFKKTTHVGL